MVCGDLKSTGLIVWINKYKMPKYVKDVIKISSKVFDNLYIITNYKYVKDTGNIKYLDYSKTLSYIFNISQIFDLQYQEIADYVAYDPINILSNVYNINVNSVFKFDSDLIPYNKFLINQITNNVDHKPFVASEVSHYLGNYGSPFYNCCLTFFNNTEESKSLSNLLVQEWLRVVKDRDHKYTATGPSMLNRINSDIPFDLNWCNNLDISIDTLKPTMPKVISMLDDKLGIHLEMSTYKRNKITGSNDVRINLTKDNYLKLKY